MSAFAPLQPSPAALAAAWVHACGLPERALTQLAEAAASSRAGEGAPTSDAHSTLSGAQGGDAANMPHRTQGLASEMLVRSAALSALGRGEEAKAAAVEAFELYPHPSTALVAAKACAAVRDWPSAARFATWGRAAHPDQSSVESLRLLHILAECKVHGVVEEAAPPADASGEACEHAVAVSVGDALEPAVTDDDRAAVVAPPAVATPAPVAPAPAPAPVPYTWSQTDAEVVVTFAVKAHEAKSRVDVREQLLYVCFPTDAAPLELRIPLHGRVQSGIYSAVYYTKKVRITMNKVPAQVGVQWPQLEGSAPVVPTAAAAAGVAAAAPTAASAAAAGTTPLRTGPAPVPAAGIATSAASGVPSAYASKKDWNAIEREVVREVEDEKVEGEAALQKLFQQIYRNADEDTRRAMNKSFQMSGGTVLSTNWKDIKDRDLERERTAPPGQEVRKWEY